MDESATASAVPAGPARAELEEWGRAPGAGVRPGSRLPDRPAGMISHGAEYEPVAVGVGSNLGDRRENLRFATRELECQLRSLRVSRVYRSRPAEGVEGGEFLNMCVVGRRGAAVDSPSSLLRELHYVELRAGRSVDRPAREPRTLDLDLLLVGERVVESEDIVLPHPRMHLRNFVLTPLSELLPDWRHPRSGERVRDLAESRGSDGTEIVEGDVLV